MAAQDERTPEERMADRLKESTLRVKQQGLMMKRALDREDRDDALKFAEEMLSTLNTADLSPKMYYDLYHSNFDQLRHLEEYFLQEWHNGSSIFDLYERVQHTNQILPRLYLLVTVGSVYIRSKEAPAKDVLKDLVEMCRGIQHPLRGLFLRQYLSQMSKDKLPDVGSEYEGQGGRVTDSIDFTLLNFTEMNKLWVRMQHQGPMREKERRESERQELRILVGTNLVRLSQLDGVDVEVYRRKVLPRILEQVVNCKDAIAQEYLMGIIIQVFPDEFHLRTLDDYLSTIESLHQSVSVQAILVSLMDRIANYAKQDGIDIPDEINGFMIFSEHVKNAVQKKGIGAGDALSLQTSLTLFARSCYPEKLEYVDQALGECVAQLDNEGRSGSFGEEIVHLLAIPLNSGGSVLEVLQLSNFPPLMNKLEPTRQRQVACELCKALIVTGAVLDTPETVEHLSQFIQPLVVAEQKAPPIDGEDDDEGDGEASSAAQVALEQQLLARLVHLLKTDNLDILFKLYQGMRKFFAKGGAERTKITLPPLLVNAIRLAGRLHTAKELGDSPYTTSAKKVFSFCHQTATTLVENGHPEVALRHFLLSAQGSALAGSAYEAITHEFVTQALSVFEEHISDSREQFAALTLVIGTLRALPAGSLGEESWESLTGGMPKLCKKLMKKQNACKAISAAAHLLWPDEASGQERKSKKTIQCLKEALKVADQCVGTDAKHVVRLVDILNEYIYFYEHGLEEAFQYFPALHQLIESYLYEEGSTTVKDGVDEATAVYYQNTCNYMRNGPSRDTFSELAALGSA